MIGKCPNCGIKLNIAPFNNRDRNEVMIVLTYRGLLENGELKDFKELGHCMVCKATKADHEEQGNLRESKNNPLDE